jgi:hypothetical protein
MPSLKPSLKTTLKTGLKTGLKTALTRTRELPCARADTELRVSEPGSEHRPVYLTEVAMTPS